MVETIETGGRRLLVEWLAADPEHRTKTLVATACGVSSSAVGQWCSGRVVPAHVYRPALSVLAGIPETAWVTDGERERANTALAGAIHASRALPPAPPSSSTMLGGGRSGSGGGTGTEG